MLLFALFQLLLGLPQLRPGGLQLGAGGGVLPDGPEHISQSHRHPAFLNREISRSSTRMRPRTFPEDTSSPFIWRRMR